MRALGQQHRTGRAYAGHVRVAEGSARCAGRQHTVHGDGGTQNFAGPVTLSAPPGGLPLGVTVDFDPQTLPEGVLQSTMRVSVSATAPVQYVAEPPLLPRSHLCQRPQRPRGHCHAERADRALVAGWHHTECHTVCAHRVRRTEW